MSVKELGFDNDEDGNVELTEVKEIDVGSNITSGRESWTCDELVPITLPIKCQVPQRIEIFMRSVERIMSMQGLGSMEFGVFLKGKFENGKLIVSGEHTFIPKQKVSGATIDFEEDPPEPTWNGVIHRHPNGCKGFSGTDSMHINRNFEFSLLYESNDIIKGIINVKAGDIRIQLPLEIEVAYPVFNIENPETITEKIQKDESMMRSSTSSRDYRHQGLAGLLTDGEDSGTIPFADREPVQDSFGADREDTSSDLYICRHCGEPNIIPEFPHVCDSCDMMLDGDDDAEYIIDVLELEPDLQLKALQKLGDEIQDEEDEEDEEFNEDIL